MGILIRKEKGLVSTTISRLAIISLIASLSYSLIDTIWAIYINSYVQSVVFVGLLSAILTLISFISYFLFIPIIEKKDKSRIYSFSLLIFALSYILFALNTKFYFFIIISFILVVFQTLRITSFGIIVRDKSYERYLSRNEGLMYAFTNVAWVIGPLISGFISEKYGIRIVFVLAAIFVLIAFFLFKISNIKDKKTKKKIDLNFYKNFIEFFKNKDRVLAYLFGGGVNYWWSLIYLFVPLLIIKTLHVAWVGYFLFAIAVPTILFPYYFGSLAGKIGFRKIFSIGFLIPCFFALLCFFTTNIYLIMAFLVLASVGLSMLESTTEAYFFDVLKGKQDLRFYGPYNTTIDVNHFIGRILSSIILIFLPFKFIFLFFSLSMFVFFLFSLKAKKIIESKK